LKCPPLVRGLVRAGPPGPAPRFRSPLVWRPWQGRRGRRPADQGGPPHNLCRCPATGKLCGIRLPACPTMSNRRRV